MAILNINGVDMPTPTEFKPLFSDGDVGSFRNANYKLIRKRKRSDVRSYFVSYTFLTATNSALLLNAIDPAEFTVICPDPKLASNATIQMYSSDVNIEMLDNNKTVSGEYTWKNINFFLVEF